MLLQYLLSVIRIVCRFSRTRTRLCAHTRASQHITPTTPPQQVSSQRWTARPSSIRHHTVLLFERANDGHRLWVRTEYGGRRVRIGGTRRIANETSVNARLM